MGGSRAFRVVVGATTGRLSGVDVFSAHLVRGLRSRGVDAHVLLTEPHAPTTDAMPFPSDVEASRLNARGTWWRRWRQMQAYLETRAPCVYIPNYDWHYSCVSPRLSWGVSVVGIVHSHDPMHYEHVGRLGAYWDAVVCVSEETERTVKARHPELFERVRRIPYGAPRLPAFDPSPVEASGPLRLVYAGRLVEEQKRCSDLIRIAGHLHRRGVPFELEIIGAGPDRADLEARAAQVAPGAVRFTGLLDNRAVLERYRAAHVVLLTSSYEGLPVSLVEAMGQGLVPVVSDSPSGIAELVVDGETGVRVPVGDTSAFADRLVELAEDPALQSRLRRGAYERVSKLDLTVEAMVERYLELFHEVRRRAEQGAFRRPANTIVPPSGYQAELRWSRRYLSPRTRSVMRGSGRRVLRVATKPWRLWRDASRARSRP